jgi:hypothetical protein
MKFHQNEGDTMKKTFLFLTLFAFACFALQIAEAQSQKQKTSDADKTDDIGERLGRKIDKFISDVTREFTDVKENDAFNPDTIPTKSRKHNVEVDLEDETKTKSFEGGKTVDREETIRGNIVVKGGDLKIYGTIEGDVLVVGGTLFVKDGGKVTGNARVINGDIVKEDGGIVEGYMDKTNSSTASYREDRNRLRYPGRTFNVPWADEQGNLDNFLFRYNRVEGIFVGLGSEKKYNWDGARSFTTFGSVGWGFRSHTWRGNLGLARQFAIKNPDANEMIELGVEGYSLTDSKDAWLIDVNENTAAAVFFHEDFRDYFQREGFTGHVAYYQQSEGFKFELKLAYLRDTYDSLRNVTDWALFGGSKSFRANPIIDAGEMRSIVASGGLSTITKTMHGPEGWSLYGKMEYGPSSLGGLFNYSQYLVDVRRYQPITSFDNLNFRVRVGSSDGTLPLQKMYDLGGLGTLHAFPFKFESGNRMVLFNAEYIINGGFLDELDFWPTWLFRNINILLLTDAGLTRTIASSAGFSEGFDKITWGEFRHDIGAGFSNRSGSFRIALAWRTDVKEPANLILRIARPY